MAKTRTNRKTPADAMTGPPVGEEEDLANRTVFRLDDQSWEAFQAALDASPRTMPRLKALLSGPGVDSDAALASRFEERFAAMQTPESKAAVRALFEATPEELGRSAVRGARRKQGR